MGWRIIRSLPISLELMYLVSFLWFTHQRFNPASLHFQCDWTISVDQLLNHSASRRIISPPTMDSTNPNSIHHAFNFQGILVGRHKNMLKVMNCLQGFCTSVSQLGVQLDQLTTQNVTYPLPSCISQEPTCHMFCPISPLPCCRVFCPSMPKDRAHQPPAFLGMYMCRTFV